MWLGDAAKIRARVVRKQKTDRRDAEHLQVLLREERFPRIWVPTLEERDTRQLLMYRHKQVQARTRTKNQLHALGLSQGVQRKRKLWTEGGRAELEKLELLPYAAIRRQRLVETRPGQSSGGAQAGAEVVLDVARELELRATVQGRGAGEPESFCGRKNRNRRLE